MTDLFSHLRLPGRALGIGMSVAPAGAQLQIRSAATPPPQVVIRGPTFNGDYIVAVANSEPVPAGELLELVV